MKAVLANAADVNERTAGGQTPLILATIFGHTHLILLLLDAGADPQLRDNLGLNAIDWAQRRGATEAIEVLSNKRNQTSVTATPPQTPPARSTTSINSDAEKSSSISEEERSRRWIAGLKQRISEQSQREVPDGPNIFRSHAAASLIESLPLFSSTEREPQPEIPAEPSKPQPELPATTPEPQPEIPAPSPDPEREIPASDPPQELTAPPPAPQRDSRSSRRNLHRELAAELRPPEPESRTQLAQPQVETLAPQTVPQEPERNSGRKRCPKCNAIYNGDLIAYCAHHIVPLVDFDEPAPIISQPQTTSPTLFWMIILITLTGSVVVGSVAAFFYSSKPVQPAAVTAPPPPAPRAVQKGTPVVSRELDGKVLSLPIAESPLNDQEPIPGTVVVRVTVSKAGQVTKAQASGADWLLRGAASEAAMKSTFAPEKLHRRSTEGTITYTFGP